MRRAVEALWPELRWIEEEALRESTLATWIKAFEHSPLAPDDLRIIPFTLLVPDCPATFMEHKRCVVHIARKSAEAMRDFLGRALEIDMDVVIAGAILADVGKLLEYEMVGGWDVPEVVLQRGSGSCSEYTYSFVALCRAAGLPARYQGSVVVRGDDASIDEAFHRWAQIYLPNYGWVPVDANRGDKPSPADQARGFGGLSNRFLITTQGGGDSEHLRWGYNAFARYQTRGYCKIEEDNFGLWEPLDSAPAP